MQSLHRMYTGRHHRHLLFTPRWPSGSDDAYVIIIDAHHDSWTSLYHGGGAGCVVFYVGLTRRRRSNMCNMLNCVNKNRKWNSYHIAYPVRCGGPSIIFLRFPSPCVAWTRGVRLIYTTQCRKPWLNRRVRQLMNHDLLARNHEMPCVQTS